MTAELSDVLIHKPSMRLRGELRSLTPVAIVTEVIPSSVTSGWIYVESNAVHCSNNIHIWQHILTWMRGWCVLLVPQLTAK